ncbi:MAG: hypothetical protein IH795_10875, partial [Bacteroidetes bacterium]|nr:hypothetical protein [Bacteroidota bacterium]
MSAIGKLEAQYSHCGILVKGNIEAVSQITKIDFKLKDAIGREWQCATIQCDFSLPERFGLKYINDEGKETRPIMIHRAILGSLERFMGALIEH